MAGLDEDAVDEILYLARANEATELESFLSEIAAQSKKSKAELLTAAADQHSKNTALHYAAANGHSSMNSRFQIPHRVDLTLLVAIIKLLFPASAERPAPLFINAVNDAGNTALHWAALNGHLESVKLLVESGADVTIINKAGHDAVFEAEINDRNDVVDWLLGAVEELENGVGQTGEDADEENETDTEAGSSVDDVRKQMEGLETKDNAPKDG